MGQHPNRAGEGGAVSVGVGRAVEVQALVLDGDALLIGDGRQMQIDDGLVVSKLGADAVYEGLKLLRGVHGVLLRVVVVHRDGDDFIGLPEIDGIPVFIWNVHTSSAVPLLPV